MDDRVSGNKITVTMVSNAMNHHQFPFCDAMNAAPGVEFRFVATAPISYERLAIGFRDLNGSRDYIIRAYESEVAKKKALRITEESDFVIYGSAPFEYIKSREKRKKWTFIYSERLFKESRKKDPLNIKTVAACTLRYAVRPRRYTRLLCSSAYSSADYRFFGFKREQCFKWGYFPPVSGKTLDEIISKKNEKSIVWVGRFIGCKHPEEAVRLAKKLKYAGCDFSIKMIGAGPLLSETEDTARKLGVADRVEFAGALPSEKVREETEKAAIMISTSDKNEGWGAVINEGMASGCAVVASHLMGSVPYLVDDGKNGEIYRSGDVDGLFSKVRPLLDDPAKMRRMGRAAYDTIKDEWNGEKAAEKLIEMMRRISAGETGFVFSDGVCSRAEYLKDDWYKGKG